MPDLTDTVRSFFAAWERGDVDAVVAHFAPTGTWQEAHRPPARGPGEIRPVLELQIGFGEDFAFEFLLLAQADDRTVVSERVDSWGYEGRRMTAEVMGVMEFDDEGRIVRWRDYYDWSALAEQLTAAGLDISDY
jgi:limonene-1,2-epoxide hydrolase